MRVLLLLLLAGCGRAPYSDYWEDPDAFPVIDSVEPAELESRNGGDEITIRGEHLSETRTVVIGGRNAKILSTEDDLATVETPTLGAGPSAVEVALVTTDGMVRLEEGLTYAPTAFSADERTSVALWSVDCPAEVWATNPADELVPLEFCGPAQGRAGARGFVTPSVQSGYAGDLAGLIPLSTLPPEGEIRAIGPGESAGYSPPLLFEPIPAGDLITITTPRSFGRDVDAVVDQIARLEANHSQGAWAGAEPIVRIFDDEVCWIDDFAVVGAEGPSLTLDGDITGAVGLWIGASAAGAEGFVATSRLSGAEGSSALGINSGVELLYNVFEGEYLPLTAAGYLGPADLPPDVTYQVRTKHLDEGVGRGAVAGVQALKLREPDLYSGAVVVPKGESFVIRWDASTDPLAALGIEIRVWDADVDAPIGETQEVAKLLARADDFTGEFTFSAIDMLPLPTAPNRVDAAGDKTGLWATLTVARHALRAVPLDEGDLVMDFTHAAQLPIALVD